MPQALPFIFKAVQAVAAFTAGSGIVNQLAKVGLQLAVAAGINALTPQPKIDMASQLQAKAGAVSPTTMIMGRTAVGGTRLTDLFRGGRKNLGGSYVTVLSSVGECGIIESIKWGDDTITFDSNGQVTSPSKYIDNMWMCYKNGSWTQTALNIETQTTMVSYFTNPTEWTSNHRALGCMVCMLYFRRDAECFKDNWHDPIFLVDANAVTLTDPRTGTTATGAARYNPAVWYYSYGQKFVSANGKHMAGLGWVSSQIDATQISYWANICDTNSWTIAGEIVCDSANNNDILRAIARAGGGEIATRNGKLSVSIAASKTSVGTITEDDLSGKITWKSAVNAVERPNRLIPRFLSEANGFKIVDGSAITDASYLTTDSSLVRSRTVEFPYVPDATQVGQLGAYALANAREPWVFNIPCKAQVAYLAQVGDAITINTTDWSSYKVVITKRTLNPLDFSCVYEAVSETDAKHAWALGESTTAPSFTAQTRLGSYSEAPTTSEWSVAADTISGGGADLPIIRVSGAVDGTEGIRSTLIYISVDGGINWIPDGSISPLETEYEIRGLTPDTNYDVGMAYVNSLDTPSAITNIGTITTDAATIVAGLGDLAFENQATTALIAPNAVNAAPSYVLTPAAIATTSTGVWLQIQSMTLSTSGQIKITFESNYSLSDPNPINLSLRLKVNGSVIKTWDNLVVGKYDYLSGNYLADALQQVTYFANPSAGTNTFSIEMMTSGAWGGQASNRLIWRDESYR